MKKDILTKEILTIAEGAEYLSVSEKTIRRMIKAKELSATKIRRVWRIKRADIEALFPSSRNVLVEKAKRWIDRLDISELYRNGIERSLSDYEFITGYPPALTLPAITQADIFPESPSIRGTSPEKEISLYIHIPFCTGLCTYCHYVRKARATHLEVDSYLEAVKAELKMLKKALQVQRLTASSLYIGGGTPTYLSGKQIVSLMEAVQESVEIAPGAEFTCEASPETATEGKLKALKSIGVSRLSLGIQSLNDDILLQVCDRRHNAQKALSAIEQARLMGFNNINVDLMYGLPDQTLYHWESTLNKLLELLPESITIYHLRLNPGTPMLNTYQEDPGRFPDQEGILIMQMMATLKLEESSYRQSKNVGWFALSPDYEYQQQEHKWKNKEFAGIGVSAYSYLNGCYCFNHRQMDRYFQAIKENLLPVWKGKKLSQEEEMRRTMVLGIKLTPGVDKSAFKTTFGCTVEDVFSETLQHLTKLGLITITPAAVKLTEKGRLFSDEVSTEFYTKAERDFLQNMKASKYGAYFEAIP